MLRASEWILVAYFSYATVVSRVLPVAPGVRTQTLLTNVVVLAVVISLAALNRRRRHFLLRIARDWFPLPLMLLAYREMGWFGFASHTPSLELSWIVWDRRLLYDWGLQAAIESLGPVLPSVLEVCYSLVYAISPFCMAWIYIHKRYESMDAYLVTFLTGIYLAYALFPYFPSEPPRSVFPSQDLPNILTPFRKFNLRLLGGYGIHLSVFPSAHCSGSMSAALAMKELFPEHPWVWRCLLMLAIGIAISTVYGRYHYAVDALAGIGLALIAWAVCRRMQREKRA